MGVVHLVEHALIPMSVRSTHIQHLSLPFALLDEDRRQSSPAWIGDDGSIIAYHLP